MNYSLPSDNVAEVTLIGTGGGYGESCVIHLGTQNWIVVDSCIDPNTKVSLPLQYLRDIGVDVRTKVRAVICTHWHNDHILGLTQLYKECENAFLSFARANDKEKFLLWVELDYEKAFGNKYSCSTSEFRDSVSISRDREVHPRLCYPDRTLITIDGINSHVVSLSPSDSTIEEFDKQLSTLISEFGGKDKKYIHTNPNHQSVVLHIQLGHHYALLGADLEVTTDNTKGWLHILDHSQTTNGKKSSLFKIPHHGSKNGYHPRIWTELLKAKPVSKGSPWNRNQCLPEADMIKEYINNTDKLYYTAGVKMSNKPKKRSKNIEKIINLFNSRVREVKYVKGIIRSRIPMEDPSAEWETELDGEAFHVNSICLQ